MDERFKEIGRYMLDVSKYVFTTVLISSLFSDKSNMNLYVLSAVAVSLLLLVWGLWFVGNSKKGGENESGTLFVIDICLYCRCSYMDTNPVGA